MASYASQWTAGAGVPTGTLTTDQPITAEQAAEAKKRWNDNASHAGGVAVLGAGMRYTPIALKPSEVQFLESRAFDVLAIGRMFGVPAHMLLASVDGSSMTYQNVNDAATDFIRWTVMAYLREIEDALTAILPRGTTARFNLDALLRADAKTRMDTHAVAIAAGIYDAATAAAIEGLPAPTQKETTK
jgi:phage portal protein